MELNESALRDECISIQKKLMYARETTAFLESVNSEQKNNLNAMHELLSAGREKLNGMLRQQQNISSVNFESEKLNLLGHLQDDLEKILLTEAEAMRLRFPEVTYMMTRVTDPVEAMKEISEVVVCSISKTQDMERQTMERSAILEAQKNVTERLRHEIIALEKQKQRLLLQRETSCAPAVSAEDLSRYGLYNTIAQLPSTDNTTQDNQELVQYAQSIGGELTLPSPSVGAFLNEKPDDFSLPQGVVYASPPPEPVDVAAAIPAASQCGATKNNDVFGNPLCVSKNERASENTLNEDWAKQLEAEIFE